VLNLLDLHLEHLDIDIRDANHAEVDAIVHTCGQSMSRVTFGAPCLLTSYRTQLDLSARSTREKAAALVSAHRPVVGQRTCHLVRESVLI
jgi:diphthamide synthase subunit DPH2